MSAYFIATFLQQGILELVLYGDLVINSNNCWVTHLKRQSIDISKWWRLSCDSLHTWL